MSRGFRDWIIVAIVGVLAAGAGIAFSLWKTAPREAASQAVAAMMAAQIPDLAGRVQSIDQWRGKVIVVNFWATWCAPCREEIPIFVRLQDKYRERGLQFVGIAIDQQDRVRPYAAELGMNFPILIGGVGAIDLTRTLGNRAGVLPYTIVLARDGTIAAAEIGAVKEAKFEPLLASLLR